MPKKIASRVFFVFFIWDALIASMLRDDGSIKQTDERMDGPGTGLDLDLAWTWKIRSMSQTMRKVVTINSVQKSSKSELSSWGKHPSKVLSKPEAKGGEAFYWRSLCRDIISETVNKRRGYR